MFNIFYSFDDIHESFVCQDKFFCMEINRRMASEAVGVPGLVHALALAVVGPFGSEIRYSHDALPPTLLLRLGVLSPVAHVLVVPLCALVDVVERRAHL